MAAGAERAGPTRAPARVRPPERSDRAAGSGASPAEQVLELQRTAGNGAVARLIAASPPPEPPSSATGWVQRSPRVPGDRPAVPPAAGGGAAPPSGDRPTVPVGVGGRPANAFRDAPQRLEFPAGGIVQAPNPTSRTGAVRNYAQLRRMSPLREVALAHNIDTGQWVVAQGAHDQVVLDHAELNALLGLHSRGRWEIPLHYHPPQGGRYQDTVRWPSVGDFEQVTHELRMRGGDQPVERTIQVALPDGRTGRARYGIDPHNRQQPWWVEVPGADGRAGPREPFATMEAYQARIESIGAPRAAVPEHLRGAWPPPLAVPTPRTPGVRDTAYATPPPMPERQIPARVRPQPPPVPVPVPRPQEPAPSARGPGNRSAIVPPAPAPGLREPGERSAIVPPAPAPGLREPGERTAVVPPDPLRPAQIPSHPVDPVAPVPSARGQGIVGGLSILFMGLNILLSWLNSREQQSRVQAALAGAEADLQRRRAADPHAGVLLVLYYTQYQGGQAAVSMVQPGAVFTHLETYEGRTREEARATWQTAPAIRAAPGRDTAEQHQEVWLPPREPVGVEDLEPPFPRVALATFAGGAVLQDVTWSAPGEAVFDTGFDDAGVTTLAVPPGASLRFYVLRPPSSIGFENIPIVSRGASAGGNLQVIDLDTTLPGDVTVAPVFPADPTTDRLFATGPGLRPPPGFHRQMGIAFPNMSRARFVRPQNIRVLQRL